MKRTVIDTGDNSKTLLISDTDVTYHSRHGAMTESKHIFIESGLKTQKHTPSISVFEMGFGTGLNALLAKEFAYENNIKIDYHTIEKYPLNDVEVDSLLISNPTLSDSEIRDLKMMHDCSWELPNQINETFNLLKFEADLTTFDLKKNQYHLIFFDAFGPKFQPKLWQPNILKKMYDSLFDQGTLVTYCAQGQFKRDLKSVGFQVENLPGPPGKREITRAIKP